MTGAPPPPHVSHPSTLILSIYPRQKRRIQALSTSSTEGKWHLSTGGDYMAHYGVLRDYKFSESANDIRGSKLYGLNDEKLGKTEDVIFDHSTGLIRYIVVDTGGWLSTKKFIVPADRLRASVKHKDD